MSSAMRIFDLRWQNFDAPAKRGFIMRMIASLIVFIVGCAVMWNLRAYSIGEDGSSLAMYFLGVLFIQTMNIGIFYKKLIFPEAVALKICLAAVIFVAAWVNIEEKVVMPMIANQCDSADCVIVYDRQIPFSDAKAVYTPQRGWRSLDNGW